MKKPIGEFRVTIHRSGNVSARRHVGPLDFKPTDLTLREMVEKYLNGFWGEFQTPEQQELARKIRERVKGL
jgi:hypothetical protein